MAAHDRDILIHPRRGRREQMLPRQAILLVNPAEARYGLETLETSQWAGRSLYNSNLVVDSLNRVCIAGPALGAPAAGLILEKLIVLGVKEIFLVSCCGTVDPAFSIGDIMLGSGAVSGVGLSRYYHNSDEIQAGPAALGLFQSMLASRNLDYREGVMWSTDAPYRERRSELIALQEEFGVCGVDMEYAALLSIAAYRSVSLAGLFVVSDVLWSRDWQPGFTVKHYRQRCERVIDTLISYLDHGGE